MSWIIGGLAVILLAVLEKFWAPYALKSLRVTGGCGKVLVRPGETVIWSTTVDNPTRLPIPFVRLQLRFPSQLPVQANPRWLRAHYREGIQQWQTDQRFALPPLRGCTRQVRFTATSRGVYSVGICRVAAGDLLGLREEGRESGGQTLVVMPDQCRDQTALDALGGFLGDISVRRFILEDPVLTVGFRDYTGREPLKAVSWTRTAVTGTMQVKQFDHTAEENVVVLLNVSGGSPGELEDCFRLTRMVCETLERRKIPYGLRTNGNLPGPTGKIFTLPEGLGASHLNAILYGLGRADYTCYASASTLVRQALRCRKHNESYIVITPPAGQGVFTPLELGGSNRICVLTGKEGQP